MSDATHSSREMPRMTLGEILTRERWIEIVRIAGVGAVIGLFKLGVAPLPVLLLAIAVGLYPLVKKGSLDAIREHRIGTEIFVTLATVISVIGKEYAAGAILLVIILVAELIAELNSDRARASIKGLIGSVPRTALVKREGREESVPIEQIRVGDVVVVRAGERVPVDGVVAAGQGSVDQSPITGESVPVEKESGAPVFAGTILALGALDVTTQRVGSETTFARIIALVEHAEETKAPVERLADRVSAWLIPVVMVFLLVVYLVTRDLKLIVTLLIFTSPAELGLATPLVMIAAISRAARAGILIKGGLHLEVLAKADAIAFDKTGTLTVGRPEVRGVEALDPSVSEDEVLRLAAVAERRSSHPLAQAVTNEASRRKLDAPEPETFEVVRGRGVRAVTNGRTIVVGNAAFLTESGFPLPNNLATEETGVFVGCDGKVLGVVHVEDAIRPGAKESIAALRRTGIKRIVMLTGDNEEIGRRIGAELGVEEVRANLMPEDKVEAIKQLQAEGFTVAMVGDGINDAPALATADVGIAMGAFGTEAAMEAADIALMTDDVGKIFEARAIAARAYRTIRENLIVGVGVVHVAGIAAALLHLIGPVQAAMIHLGPDILVFVNSVKLLRVRIPTVADEDRNA